ncbi:hypothetical protein DMUE_5201 [Dictyocoela muelleri]|nr:hypothetical protein DMUE_5201 [Dictyocoela muelleri]
MIHGTTRFPLSQLLYVSNYENTVERFYTNEELNSMLNQYRLWMTEDGNLEDMENGNFISWEMNTRRGIRDISVLNSDISADRMVRRSMWPNDISVLQIGCRVIRRVHVDTNINTRQRPLFEHLDTQVYVILSVNYEHNSATLQAVDEPRNF